MNRNLLLLVVFSFVMFNCTKKPCQSTNEILSNNAIESEEYISELVKLIDNSNSEINYWFDSYNKEGENEFITLNIQSVEICAKGKFLVKDWTGIEQLQKVKGESYKGSRFKGFKFTVDTLNGVKILSFKALEKIVD